MTLRHTLRSLRHRPGFAGLVILTLGLGIGAATAIFTVVNAVLLKPLPYRDPSGLAMIWSKWSNFDKTWVSLAEYADYQRQTQLFEDVALWNTGGEVTLTGPEGHAESVSGAQATANLLDVLGVTPAAGQMFSAAEDVPNGPAVVMVGYDLWRRRWSGDPGLVGKTIQVDGQPYRVSGILPRDFRLPLEFQSRNSVQLLGPVQMDRSAPSRGSHCCYTIGRLKPGVTAGLASNEIHALATQWTQQGLYPVDMRFQPFAVSLDDEVTGPVRPALVLLVAAVTLLLVLTCANVANLMLTRASDRGREMAVRAALGAGIRDMLRLALGESLVLGLAGGALGLGLAWAGVRRGPGAGGRHRDAVRAGSVREGAAARSGRLAAGRAGAERRGRPPAGPHRPGGVRDGLRRPPAGGCRADDAHLHQSDAHRSGIRLKERAHAASLLARREIQHGGERERVLPDPRG